jgi:hypothetical protein
MVFKLSSSEVQCAIPEKGSNNSQKLVDGETVEAYVIRLTDVWNYPVCLEFEHDLCNPGQDFEWYL